MCAAAAHEVFPGCVILSDSENALFITKRTFHYRIVIFDFFKKRLFYKTLLLIWRSYKKKIRRFALKRREF